MRVPEGVFGSGMVINVPASQASPGMILAKTGGAGNQGDYIESVLIVPEGLSPGIVQLTDGGDTPKFIYIGGVGANGLNAELRGMPLEFHMRSKFGPWRCITGGGVHAIFTGRFT